MRIFILGEQILRQNCVPIEVIDKSIADLAQQMLKIMYKSDGVGLAAPQIGKSLRMFVTHVEKDVPRVFINPQILSTSLETAVYEEGCLSIPQIYREVARPRRISVQAMNEYGKPFTLTADGLLARCILHEYDHLDGRLFIDRIDETEREKIIADFDKKRRKSGKNKGA